MICTIQQKGYTIYPSPPHLWDTYMINWIKVITPNNIDFHILNHNLITFYLFVMNSIWTILYSSSRDTSESDAFCSKCWLGIFTQYNMRGQWIPESKHHMGICIWVQTQGNDLKYNLLCLSKRLLKRVEYWSFHFPWKGIRSSVSYKFYQPIQFHF